MDQPDRSRFQTACLPPALPAISPSQADPWPIGDASHAPLPSRLPPHNSSRTTADFGFGLERRLPRRAETLWQQLAANNAPPPASAAAPFLRSGYAANALHIQSLADGALMIDHIGEALQPITQLHCGRYPDGSQGISHMASEIGEELLDLAQAAMKLGTLLRLETERMSNRLRPGTPHLLLRAVALPFAPVAGSGEQAVVIASWRKLLSSEETAVLNRELTVAMDWIRRQRPRG